jgi:hypothetical protein
VAKHGWISALSNFAQKSLRFSTGRLHGPRGAMKTDCVKALLASCSIFQDVHWVSALLPHTKSSHVTIPDGTTHWQSIDSRFRKARPA